MNISPGTINAAEAKTYDLAVIGAGSAGFSAAIGAAELGAQVALIGHGTIGGTCVNIGCVPSKTLIRAADALHASRAASRFDGIRGGATLDNWQSLLAQKDELVATLRSSKYANLLSEYDAIHYLEGEANFTKEGVFVDGNLLRSPRTIIATGAAPTIPSIPGLESVRYLTSTEALELSTLPTSLVVIGAGYIGLELAQMFRRFGVEVTVVCRSRLLPAAEPEISQALEAYLVDEGIRVVKGVSYRRAEATSDGARLIVETEGDEMALEGQHLLVATGRQPNSANLGLDAAEIRVGENGGIIVDEHLQTSNPNTYAVGDVTGRDMYVYMAAYGGRRAAENALNDAGHRYDSRAMPAVTFTDPQVASVGLTERTAKDLGHPVKTTVLPMDAVPRALAARDTRGLVKLVANSETDILLGAHILAPEAGDSIQTAAVAIAQNMTAKALSEMIFPYLTSVESLKLAAQTFEKDISKLSCCAG
ncbi:MAG: mercury(II) reductase [Alphaproteobacteria bacterium]